jgi:hypothetical protein
MKDYWCETFFIYIKLFFYIFKRYYKGVNIGRFFGNTYQLS